MGWIDTLDQLFTQKTIIKKMPGNRVKTLDFGKIQTLSADTFANYRRLSRTNTPGRFSGYTNTPDIEALELMRQQLYQDYSMMDTDPILSCALDVYADEVTAKSAQGYMLTVKSENVQIKKILYNLFYDILNIEFNLWSWVRTTCKFGDLMLYLKTEPTVGIVDVLPIHPAFLRRDDYSGENKNKTVFKYEGPVNTSISARHEFPLYEIAHFRLLTDTDFIPYGKSMLDGARKVYKQLMLMEDAMLLHRIMRAPERRVFKIDVGGIPPESIDAYIESISSQMKKVPLMDANGNYNLRYNLMNMLEDYYLPQRNSENGTTIEPLEGMKNDGAIDDIEYLRKKLVANLKIPLSFLGYETAGDVKTSLASEDIRFARTTERIQKIFNSELTRIAVQHLYIQGFSEEELLDFEICLSPPSMIYERQKIDLLNEKVNLIQNIRENKLWSRKRIYEEIFEMSESEWKAEIEQIAQDLKEDFRFKQIEEEGNDPTITKKSFGTPHDIASLHMASKFDNPNESSGNIKQLYSPDEREDNPGRPEKQGSFNRHKDPAYGLDPFGEKEMKRKAITNVESVKKITSLIPSTYAKTKNIEKLYEEISSEPYISMLDEKQLEKEND